MADVRREVDAIVVNYNAGNSLIDCVRSLRAEGVEGVVVVDNDSRDGSVAALTKADGDVHVVRTGANLGFGRAANRGATQGERSYLLVLNPDVVVEPGTLKALIGALERDQALAAVGPRVEQPDGTLYPSARRFPDLYVAAGHAFLGFVAPDNRFSRAYKLADFDHSRAGVVDWISGSCMLVRRSAYEAVGGFDEAYFMYVEDVDLCWRLGRAGWRIGYEPAGRVVHIGGLSADRTPYRMILEHHRSLWRFARTTTTGRRRLVLPLVAVGLAVRTPLAWTQRAVDGWRQAARRSGTQPLLGSGTQPLLGSGTQPLLRSGTQPALPAVPVAKPSE